MGMKQGKEIGFALSYLLEKVLDNPELNTENNLKKMLDKERWF